MRRHMVDSKDKTKQGPGRSNQDYKDWVARIRKRAREREKRLESLFNYRSPNNKSKSNIIKATSNSQGNSSMSYEFKVSARKLEPVFGRAYPGLSMSPKKKARLLETIYRDKYNLKSSREYINRDTEGVVTVSIKVAGFFRFFLSKVFPNVSSYNYVIEISGKEISTAYMVTTSIEKHAYSLKNKSSLNPRSIMNRIMYARQPKDVFMLNELNMNDVNEWLQENVDQYDYQIYSKFGNDFTLGFRNPEHATMFKLAFGDENLPSSSN